jgi:hypothetical protein
MPGNTAEIKLEDALLKAFSLESMNRMLRRQLGIILEQELDVHRGTKYIFGDLVQLSVEQGWRDDLVRGALADNSKNPSLLKAARVLGISTPEKPIDAPAGSIAVADLDRVRLEKVARERGVTIRFEAYAGRLQALAHQMCLIEIPAGTGIGTGWLVAPDLMLTNYHVVKEVHESKVAAADVTCRFDYFADGAGGVAVGLVGQWLEDWSPYAMADERADAPDPTIDELDYALIRLARAVGDEDVAGSQRGWVEIQATPPAVLAEDLVMVPQFPGGRSLELSFGMTLEYNKSGTRLRYSANTEEGASGSPAMTMGLEPFGLHHAGGPGRGQKYNQCVPLRLIIQRMIKDKAPQFWRP